MRPRGFTLVELLVVVAIISLLLTLSVSGLRLGREQARAVACAANVRQLLTGLIAYESANERFPSGFELPDPGARSTDRHAGSAGFMDVGGWWWFDRIQNFDHLTMDGYKTLTCPSKRQGNPWLDVNILCGNYGANLSVLRTRNYLTPYKPAFLGMPLSLHEIPRPSETLLLVDSGYTLISWWHVTAEPPVPLPVSAASSGMFSLGSVQHAAYVPGMSLNRDKAVCQGQTDDAIGGRHPHKTVNVGLADGSVAIKRQADSLRVEKTGDDQWDNSPLWQPKPALTDLVAVTPTAPTP